MKNTFRLLLLLLFFLGNIGFAKAFSGSGSGTAGDPYLVTSAAQLDEVRNNLTAYYKQTTNIDLSSYSDWVPIGGSSTANSLSGTYDGNGYQVTGLTITSNHLNYNGLFTIITTTGTVKNLGVSGTITAGAYPGLLAGRNYGLVQNCWSSGTINGTCQVCGGLLSQNYNGTMTNCYSSVNISSSNNSGTTYIGGLVGYTTGSITTNGIIQNCYATGDIIHTGATGYTGGFIGVIWADYVHITNCYSSGAVSGVTHGGFMGYFHGTGATLTDCFFDYETADTTAISGVGTPTGVTAKTTAQMQTASTFSTWDNWTWNLKDGRYPKLFFTDAIWFTDTDFTAGTDIAPFDKSYSDASFTITPETHNYTAMQTDNGFLGFYCWNSDVGNSTEFTISVPAGSRFDLNSFGYFIDDRITTLTITLTFTDASTDTKVYPMSGLSTGTIGRFSNFTTPADNVVSVKFVSDDYITYNYLETTDVKTIYYWDGSESADWNTAENWDANAVPGATVCAVINNTGTQPVITSGQEINCKDLTVNSGASLTLNDGASLITNGTVSGTVTVLRFLNGLARYHYISSPINNANLASIFDPSYQNDIYLRSYNESAGSWENIEIPATLTNGMGYSFVIQTKSLGVTATFAGDLITSNVSPTVTNNGTSGNTEYDGWNLIGNPFTSAIKWGQGTWNRINIDNAVYTWDNGSYVSYASGVGALTDGIIPAQQAFFVKANAASPSLTIPTGARLHSSQSFYKNTITNVLRLDVANNVNEYTDAAFIRFSSEATAGVDNGLDAYKLDNDEAAPMIYTMAGDVRLSINALPSVEENPEIPVTFTAGVDGRYTLTASGMETFVNGDIILTDLLTNARQNLSQNPVYSFDATTGDEAARFKLSFAAVGVEENPLQNIGIYAANGHIVLQLPETIRGQVTVTNLAGQVIAKQNIKASGNLLLNAPAVTGVYLVTLTSENSTITRKALVK